MTPEEDLRYGVGDDWFDEEYVAAEEHRLSMNEHAERIAEQASIHFSDALALVQNPTRPGGTVA